MPTGRYSKYLTFRVKRVEFCKKKMSLLLANVRKTIDRIKEIFIDFS